MVRVHQVSVHHFSVSIRSSRLPSKGDEGEVSRALRRRVLVRCKARMVQAGRPRGPRGKTVVVVAVKLYYGTAHSHSHTSQGKQNLMTTATRVLESSKNQLPTGPNCSRSGCVPWPPSSLSGSEGRERTCVADCRPRRAYRPYLEHMSDEGVGQQAALSIYGGASGCVFEICPSPPARTLHLMPLTRRVTPCTASPSCAMMLPTRRCTCISRPSLQANSSRPPSHAPSSVRGT
jgi:hypothetical protein